MKGTPVMLRIWELTGLKIRRKDVVIKEIVIKKL